MRWIQRALRSRKQDAGFTLPELLISMTIFAAFLAVITATVATMMQDVRHTTTIGLAAAQNQRAFDAFEKEVRPADAVNWPGQSGSDWYIELHTRSLTDAAICVQWRLLNATDQLEQRSWSTVGDSPTAAVSGSVGAWAIVSTGVVNTTNPFSLAVPSTSSGTQADTVTLNLTDTQGVKPTGTATTSTTVVAESTTSNTPSNSDTGVAGTSDTPVCQNGVARP